MIAIIGGSGFIGTRLSLRLSLSKKSFQIIDKVSSSFFPEKVLSADIRLPILTSFSKVPSALINLAAEHRDDVRPLSLYDEVNVDGARNVCEFARAKNINKII